MAIRYSRLVGLREDRPDRIQRIIKIKGNQAERGLVLLGLGSGSLSSRCVIVLLVIGS